jgi:hypothetical protein
MFKKFYEELIGGAITASLGTLIIYYVQQLETITVEILAASVFALFAAYWIVKFITRYINFFVSRVFRFCGLYIETYIASNDAGKRFVVIAPFVLFFDLKANLLAIEGAAFEVSNDNTIRSHAEWWSKVVHAGTPSYDEMEIYSIHDGQQFGKPKDEIPGITYSIIPREHGSRYRSGYFCDLKPINRAIPNDNMSSIHVEFRATYFETIRATYEQHDELVGFLRSRIRRLIFLLRLGGTDTHALQLFVEKYQSNLIVGIPNEAGPILREATSLLNQGASNG